MASVAEWMAREQGKHLCQCGCGKPIQIKKWHHSAGIPRFIRGHMPLESRNTYNPVRHEVRECACGCGEQVSGTTNGKPIVYRQGHWARVANPMKREEVAAKHQGQNHPRAVPLGTRRIKQGPRGPYVRIKCPDGVWRLEHRHIMEQRLGRVLKTSEHVHHINHDTLDNRPENLMVLSASEHSKLHCVFPNARR